MARALDPGDTAVQVARFSTENYAPQDRYEAWRSEHPLSPARFMESRPVGEFFADTAWFALGARPYHFTHIAEQEWERTVRHTRDDMDAVVVNLRFSGGAAGDMDGTELSVPGGSIIFTDFRRPQSHRSDPCACLALALSREEAQALAGGIDLHGLALMPDVAQLARGHARRLHGRAMSGMLTTATAHRDDAVLLHLLEAALASARGERPSRTAALVAAKERVLQDIEANLGSPLLTVARLCRRAGISRSSLYRLFEEEGGIHSWIRERRLERIAAALRSGEPHVTIGMLAERWGFCDAAYLGRVFRETYGVTPGDFRAGADG